MNIICWRDPFNPSSKKSPKKGPWAAHVGFGTWDGREIRTEIYPDAVGTKHKQSYEETKQEMNETISKFYPTSDNKFDANLKSFAPSNVPVSFINIFWQNDGSASWSDENLCSAARFRQLPSSALEFSFSFSIRNRPNYLLRSWPDLLRAFFAPFLRVLFPSFLAVSPDAFVWNTLFVLRTFFASQSQSAFLDRIDRRWDELLESWSFLSSSACMFLFSRWK